MNRYVSKVHPVLARTIVGSSLGATGAVVVGQHWCGGSRRKPLARTVHLGDAEVWNVEHQGELHWNEEATRCAACGIALPPHNGYHVYGPAGLTTLCPPCYRGRISADDGGPTHDLAAEVDGASG